MKTEPGFSSETAIIKIHADQDKENPKARKAFKVIQTSAVDKENIVGKSRVDKPKLALEGEKTEIKRKKLVVSVAVQTEIITEDDLTSEEASKEYWRLLAEKRQERLDESLRENETLKEAVQALSEENKICKQMLEESQNLVEVLQEMLDEPDDDDAEIIEENTDTF